jgi:DNA-binding transcriptional MerR regulator
MVYQPVVIPEKIYFKIGDVCELLDVQAHVLRYWETEFSMLSPQKNKSGQRSYRRRDVEIALRIKELLYQEMFTIAGARKKLQAEIREGFRSKAAKPPKSEVPAADHSDVEAPFLWDIPEVTSDESVRSSPSAAATFNGEQRDAVRLLAGHLLELRRMLIPKPNRVENDG